MNATIPSFWLLYLRCCFMIVRVQLLLSHDAKTLEKMSISQAHNGPIILLSTKQTAAAVAANHHVATTTNTIAAATATDTATATPVSAKELKNETKKPVPYILTRTQLPHLVRAINCFIMYLFSYIEYFIHFDGKTFLRATTNRNQKS